DRALNDPDTTRDRGILAMLDQWLLRPRRNPYMDLRQTVAACGDRACAPIPVAMRPPTDFLWQRDPFQLAGGGAGTIETAGIDYILPYWIARYYQVNAAFTVQSSASGSVLVAPDSLASIYGSQLAGTTEHAPRIPLPTSLGGI